MAGLQQTLKLTGEETVNKNESNGYSISIDSIDTQIVNKMSIYIQYIYIVYIYIYIYIDIY